MRRTLASIATIVFFAATASAQVTPAAGFTPPNDTQSLRVGVTVFVDNTYTLNPKGTSADCAATAGCSGNFTPSAFNVGRAYVNLTGTLSHIVSYRVTPDITGTNNIPYRLKYAYAQFSLDDWIKNSAGNWVKFGQQQTPWIDFEEGIYRYRFQGSVFSDRNGYLSSSDRGVSVHYNFPSNYGDVLTGIYNGESYSGTEAGTSKAWMSRVTLRPFARMDPRLRGLRATLFYDKDSYQADAERTRLIAAVTFEYLHLNTGFHYLVTHDQASALGTPLNKEGKGYSFWAVPKQGTGNVGWEGVFRYDHMVPDNRSTVIPGTVNVNGTATANTTIAFKDQERNRGMFGVAYWFPHPGGNGTAAILFNYEILTTGPGFLTATGCTAATCTGITGTGAAVAQFNPSLTASAPFLSTPTLKTFSIHALLNF